MNKSKHARRREKRERMNPEPDENTLLKRLTPDSGRDQEKDIETPAKVRSLTWFMVTDFNLIPRYLVEMIPDRQFEVEEFYRLGNVFIQDPLQLLFALINEDKLVKGFMWFHVVAFTKSIFVNAFAVDPQYRGGAIEYALEHLRAYYDRLKLTGAIRWSTTQPELYEKHGLKRSKFILMEA